MGEGDVQNIRADLVEVKQSLAELTKAVADLRVLVAGNYVTRSDFGVCQKNAETRILKLHERIDKHEESEKAARYKLTGLVFTISAFVFGIIQWVVSLAKGGGNNP